MTAPNLVETAAVAHAHPRCHPDVVVTRTAANNEEQSTYWLRQPDTNVSLQLSADEYVFWRQMDGQTSPLGLLAYYWRRYQQFPYRRLKDLLGTFQTYHFVISATPLEPKTKGHPLVGLDDLFYPLTQRLEPLFSWIGQVVLLFVIFLGGGLFINLVWRQTFFPFPAGAWSLLTLLFAYLLVHLVRQLGQGIWLTQAGGKITNGRLFLKFGFPQLELDTSDCRRLPRRQRYWFAMSGTMTMLLLGGLIGLLLTAVSTYTPQFLAAADRFSQLLFGCLYQLGLLAYLHALSGLNPFAAGDGREVLDLWREEPSPSPSQSEGNAIPPPAGEVRWGHQLRNLIFPIFATLYFMAILALVRYLWQTQLSASLLPLWRSEPWGRLWLALASVALVPLFGWVWQQSRSWREHGWYWLSQRPLFTRPDTLFVLLALPLLGLPFLIIGLGISLQNELVATFLIWLLHVGAVFVWYSMATLHPAEAQVTAVFWLLTGTIAALSFAWLGEELPLLRTASLVIASSAVLLSGIYAGFTLTPRPLPLLDLILMGLLLLFGISLGMVLNTLQEGLTAVSLYILGATTIGLCSLIPAIRNFSQTDFIYPWTVLFFACLLLPWLFFYPQVHFLIVAIWLFAGVFHIVLYSLSQRRRPQSTVDAPFSTTFQQFMQRLFEHATTLLGQRPLAPIKPQLAAVRFHKGPYTVSQQSFLLVAARLTDLSSAALVETLVRLTLQAFPWQAQQQLNKRVLLPTAWDEPLTTYLQQAYAERRNLLQQTAVFPNEALSHLLTIAEEQTIKPRQPIVSAATLCTHWHLVLKGRVKVSPATIRSAGSWFGGEALANVSHYEETAVAETVVRLLSIPHDKLLPLLHQHRSARQRLAQMQHLTPKLKKQPILSNLPINSLALLAAHMESVTLGKGEQTEAGLYLVETGALASPEGDSTTLFGFASLTRPTADSTPYQARRRSRLWRLSPNSFERLLNGRFQVSQ